jgi:hypothetical protein
MVNDQQAMSSPAQNMNHDLNHDLMASANAAHLLVDLGLPREIDAPAVIADEIGGETLVINLNTGSYFVIPPASLGVWNALASGVPAASLLQGEGDPRADGLRSYIAQLLDVGLLREAAQGRSHEAIEWSAEDLRIEQHTDMADLLGLDPIHDADANVGWPMRKPE